MQARSLVFDLFGEYFRNSGGTAKLGVLTELMGIFDIEAATVRMVMTRLRKEGWFDSTKSGREVSYVLNDDSWRLLDDGRLRIFERQLGDWDNQWTQALVDESYMGREQRTRIEKSLTWWGFGHHSGCLWFSPHDREKQLRAMLQACDEPHLVILRSHTGGLVNDRILAERCWDLGGLGAGYQTFMEEFKPRISRLGPETDPRVALVERMELIQSYRKYPFRDPNLPEALLPSAWRGRAAHELFIEGHERLRTPAEQLVAEIVARFNA
ncbi:PaaX family transcriptional regulator [Rhodococcoides fascians A21d2]|nr:PaaX family transcriptional regulator [Rhodococcus fascians A21d2]